MSNPIPYNEQLCQHFPWSSADQSHQACAPNDHNEACLHSSLKYPFTDFTTQLKPVYVILVFQNVQETNKPEDPKTLLLDCSIALPQGALLPLDLRQNKCPVQHILIWLRIKYPFHDKINLKTSFHSKKNCDIHVPQSDSLRFSSINSISPISVKDKVLILSEKQISVWPTLEHQGSRAVSFHMSKTTKIPSGRNHHTFCHYWNW